MKHKAETQLALGRLQKVAAQNLPSQEVNVNDGDFVPDKLAHDECRVRVFSVPEKQENVEERRVHNSKKVKLST
jgi:hypothetical protein